MRRYPFDEAAGSGVWSSMRRVSVSSASASGCPQRTLDKLRTCADRVRIAEPFGHRYRLESRRLGLFVRQSAVGGTDRGMAGSDRDSLRRSTLSASSSHSSAAL